MGDQCDLDYQKQLQQPIVEKKPQSKFWPLYHKASAVLLDSLALFAGSTLTFGTVCVLILAWAIAGIFVHDNQIWQISMQDVSSIGCYLWDITLLFAQQQDNRELAKLVGNLQASGVRKARVMQQLQKAGVLDKPLSHPYTAIRLQPDPNHNTLGYRALPQKSWYDTLADRASVIAGSPYSQCIYAAGIILWLAYGPSMDFNDDWQLDVNTATAVELLIMTTFLQNTKRRHRLYMHRCINLITLVDDEIEERLHAAALENQIEASAAVKAGAEEVKPQSSSRVARVACTMVDRYALFIGSIGGIIWSVLLLGLWLGLGKLMGYDDSNWWLIIGTYTGLAGFIDAFVLRNVMKRQNAALLDGCDALDKGDLVTSSLLGLTPLDPPPYPKGGLFHRMSMRLGSAAAHICTVFLAVATVIGLLITATAMMWTQTAQLLCNTPTMIIEGAMLLVLMMAHMSTHEYMRARLQTFLQRRFTMQLALDKGGMGAEALNVVKGADVQTPMPNEV